MRVSQRLDYAIRCLVLLAQQPPGARIASGELAERLGLPRRFVEQQVTELARAHILTCARGASGGCSLARAPEDVSVRDVVVALEGEVLDVPHTSDSAASDMWGEVAAGLGALLAKADLRQLALEQSALDAARAGLYDI